MKLSVTTMPWGKTRSGNEIQAVLESIKDIGFEGVGIEYSLIPNEFKHEPERLASLMKKVGLQNGGSYSRIRPSDIPWAKQSETPLFWVTVKDRSTKVALSRLSDFVKKSRREGIVSALHNELRSSFETQAQLEEALGTIRGLTLCIDTAHGAGAGVDSLELMEKYPDRISLVHLKDLRSILPKSKIRFKRDFVNVGEGSLDLKSVVKKLEEIGYKGQLMLEIEALAGQGPDAAVKMGYEYINKIL